MERATTKAALTAALRAERERWEQLLEEVGEVRMTTPGVAGGWSVNDLLAHLAAYLRFWGAQINGAVTGVPPNAHDLYDRETVPPGLGTITLDKQNALIAAQYRELPPDVVLEKWRKAFALLIAGVAALEETDLATPGRFAWAGDQPL